MLFGFTAAVLVGFLLTAIPNWTGRPTITGAPLAGLAALWLAGRMVMLAGDGLPWQVVAAIDVAFLPLAAGAMLPPLIATRNRRNIVFPFILFALALANLALHLDAAGVMTVGADVTRGVLGIMMVVLVLMGGRVIPFFTRNRLPAAEVGQQRAAGYHWLMVATVLAAVLSVAAPLTVVSGLAALAAAVLLVARALPWKPWATRKVPDAVGAARRPCLDRGCPVPAGRDGSGVGSAGQRPRPRLHHRRDRRADPGHDGPHRARPYRAADRGDTPDDRRLPIMNLAALVRVFGPMAAPELHPLIGLSGVLWALAFLLFLIEYAPILAGARIDGRPG